MSRVVVFALEPLDSRYTKQWLTSIPEAIDEKQPGKDMVTLTILGEQRSTKTTDGAFLNFTDTNYWKSSQLCKFVELVDSGVIRDDDVMLFTDFWNPALIQVAYMRDLLDKDWKIHGIAHAGAYDPTDILGLKMRPEWPLEFERSLFYASDKTYFASNFHKQQFLRNLKIDPQYFDRAILSGQPHKAIIDHMKKIKIPTAKSRKVIWPHRYNEDKQPLIAEDLAKGRELMITQNHNFTKDKFYNILADSKVLFSCALHENLGISVMEGVLLDVIPLVPDRCSYKEMYSEEFKYPSMWTENYENYIKYRPLLEERLNSMLGHPHLFADALQKQKEILISNYLTADVMIDHLLSSSE
jgi:hypothetical protein